MCMLRRIILVLAALLCLSALGGCFYYPAIDYDGPPIVHYGGDDDDGYYLVPPAYYSGDDVYGFLKYFGDYFAPPDDD